MTEVEKKPVKKRKDEKEKDKEKRRKKSPEVGKEKEQPVTARQKAIAAAAATAVENKRWVTWQWGARKVFSRPKKIASFPEKYQGNGHPAANNPPTPSIEELLLTQKITKPTLTAQTLEGFAQYLKKCKKVVVCVGAGASVAAGIPDFRTPGKGLYSNKRLREYNVPRPEDVFNLRYFKRRPDACFSMLGDMWPGRWPPTRVHYFLRLLYDKKMLTRVYTQNIDDLERLAGVPADLLIEAHGTFSYVQCVDCGFSPPVETMKQSLAKGVRPMCPECLKTTPPKPQATPPPDIRIKNPTAPSKRLFVYGALRPDDSAHIEPLHSLFKDGVDFMPAYIKGVRLYHDTRPVIRIPDPGATESDKVTGYLMKMKDETTFRQKLSELDSREGCTVLCERATINAYPQDGGDPVQAEVYHYPNCARHTLVPHGDWEKRRDWKSLPEIKGLIKPGIVFFDEELPEEFSPSRIEQDMSGADALIIVGTSLRVTPFCWLPQLVKTTCPRLLLNLNAREVGHKANFTLGWPGWRDVAHDGDCQIAVTKLAELLGWGPELLRLKSVGDERMRAQWRDQEAGCRLKTVAPELTPPYPESIEGDGIPIQITSSDEEDEEDEEEEDEEEEEEEGEATK